MVDEVAQSPGELAEMIEIFEADIARMGGGGRPDRAALSEGVDHGAVAARTLAEHAPAPVSAPPAPEPYDDEDDDEAEEKTFTAALTKALAEVTPAA